MSVCSQIQPINFYNKEKMSGKGRGKSEKRDMVDASVIRAAPGKVKSKGNIHKKAKKNEESKSKPATSKTPATSRSISKKVAKKHDQFSSSSEKEVVGEGVETSPDESQMSVVDEIPIASDEEERRR